MMMNVYLKKNGDFIVCSSMLFNIEAKTGHALYIYEDKNKQVLIDLPKAAKIIEKHSYLGEL